VSLLKSTGRAYLTPILHYFASFCRPVPPSFQIIALVVIVCASHDQSDYAGLADLQKELSTLESSMGELELRWLELSELLGD